MEVTNRIVPDRRLSPRFELQEWVSYAVVEGGKTVESGLGVTTNLSSTGIAFTTERPLRLNSLIELLIPWPRRSDAVSTRVMVSGHIVRVDDGMAACAITNYDFENRIDDQPAIENVSFALRDGESTHPLPEPK